jgi:hypothetical protein
MKHLENFHDMLPNNALCWKGQSHCIHFEVKVCIVHTFPMWLVDATNVMSSPFGRNNTFVFGMSQAHKRAVAIMPSCFFVFHITKVFALHFKPIMS